MGNRSVAVVCHDTVMPLPDMATTTMTTPQSWIQLRAFKSVFADETTEILMMTTRQKFQELSSLANQPTTKRDV